MAVLTNIKPEKVFRYFEEICAIPHGSGNVDQITFRPYSYDARKPP